MISFMDKTFCSSPNCSNKCGRQLTPELIEKAKKWWGGDGFPVSVREFCGGEEVVGEVL